MDNELFYSVKDKRLFWVAGYTDNSYDVNFIIRMLRIKRKIFREMTKISNYKKVKTDFITKSSRYKSMRYFWVDNIEIDKVPEEAFQLGTDWDMMKWLEN